MSYVDNHTYLGIAYWTIAFTFVILGWQRLRSPMTFRFKIALSVASTAVLSFIIYTAYSDDPDSDGFQALKDKVHAHPLHSLYNFTRVLYSLFRFGQ